MNLRTARARVLSVTVLLLATALGSTAPPASAQDVTLPSATLTASLGGDSTVGVNTRLVVGGQMKAPAGGVLQSVGQAVAALIDALRQPLAAVAGSSVTLQLQTPTGWSTIASAPTDAAGGYALGVPTYFYGSHTWRVVGAATSTSLATGSAPFTVTVAPPFAATGSALSYKLLSTDNARWNPCAPVVYHVNRRGMPKRALGVIAAALDKVHQATGLTFVYGGATHAVPYARNAANDGMPDSGFTIAWSTKGQVPQLRGSTVAISGAWTRSTQVDASTWSTQYFAGGLVIDRSEGLRTRMGRGKTLGYVIMHEMGHVVGLDHTRDRSQVMSPTMNSRSSTQYGAGDLAGLAAVGLGGGCL